MKREIWRKINRGLWGTAVLGLMAALSGCGSGSIQRQASTDTAMGTIVSQTLYVSLGNIPDAPENRPGEGQGDECAQVLALLTELERQELSWRMEESEIAAINALSERCLAEGQGIEGPGQQEACGSPGPEEGNGTAAEITVSLSAPMRQILEQIWRISIDSEGALDVTMGRLSRLWNLDETAAGAGNGEPEAEGLGAGNGGPGAGNGEPEAGGPGAGNGGPGGRKTAAEGEAPESGAGADRFCIPTAGQIQSALGTAGYRRVRFSGESVTLPAGMQLDLGAVGKGIACDRISAWLRSRPQVSGAVVAVGGSVVTYGQKPDGSPWKVAIAHPRREGSFLGVLSLTGERYVSTSGDYERYVTVDGVRYHHILDPATGSPARSGLCSVTVVCDSGLRADALSTACFVLGPEKGLALARACGAEALLVEEDCTLHMTEGMKKLFSAAR